MHTPWPLRQSNIYHSLEIKSSLSDFELLVVLGQGAYGKVLKVKHKRTQQIFALKAVKKETVIEGDDVDIILREKKILALADKACGCDKKHSWKRDRDKEEEKSKNRKRSLKTEILSLENGWCSVSNWGNMMWQLSVF